MNTVYTLYRVSTEQQVDKTNGNVREICADKRKDKFRNRCDI